MKETLRQSFGFAQDMAQGSARGQEEATVLIVKLRGRIHERKQGPKADDA